MPHRITFIPAFLLLALITAGSAGPSVRAQSGSDETIVLPVGSIFEMRVADPEAQQAGWVLTRNGDFIEAGQQQTFRTRFSQTGTFRLEAETKRGDNRIRRIFRLRVRPRRPGDRPSGDEHSEFVRFDPSATHDQQVVLPPSRHTIVIQPVQRNFNLLAVDLDGTYDSNNDGNPKNDDDTRGTLFRSEANPLHLWFPQRPTQRTMRIGALFSDGNTAFTSVTVTTAETRTDASSSSKQPSAEEPSEEQEPETAETGIGIVIQRNDNGRVQFSTRLPDLNRASVPYLFQWDFGDGSSSLLDHPAHTYPSSGTYEVTLRVRNLDTGKVTGTYETQVVVNRLQESGGAVGPSVGDGGETGTPAGTGDDTQEDDGGGFAIGGILWTIGEILLVLAVFAGIGMGIVLLIKKLRGGRSLEETLAEAEKNIVGKKGEEGAAQEAPPLEVKGEEVEETEETKEAGESKETEEKTQTGQKASQPAKAEVTTPAVEKKTEEQPAQPQTEESKQQTQSPHDAMQPDVGELQADKQQAPSWLAQGLDEAEKKQESAATPPGGPLGQESGESRESEETKESGDQSRPGQQAGTAQPQQTPPAAPAAGVSSGSSQDHSIPDWLKDTQTTEQSAGESKKTEETTESGDQSRPEQQANAAQTEQAPPAAPEAAASSDSPVSPESSAPEAGPAPSVPQQPAGGEPAQQDQALPSWLQGGQAEGAEEQKKETGEAGEAKETEETKESKDQSPPEQKADTAQSEQTPPAVESASESSDSSQEAPRSPEERKREKKRRKRQRYRRNLRMRKEGEESGESGESGESEETKESGDQSPPEQQADTAQPEQTPPAAKSASESSSQSDEPVAYVRAEGVEGGHAETEAESGESRETEETKESKDQSLPEQQAGAAQTQQTPPPAPAAERSSASSASPEFSQEDSMPDWLKDAQTGGSAQQETGEEQKSNSKAEEDDTHHS